MSGANDKTIQFPEEGGAQQRTAPPRRDPLVGSQLGECRIERVIGKGGMATVYLGRQKGLDREVAVKVLAPRLTRDAKQIGQFVREAKTLARLEHPNIVTVYQVGHEERVHFLVLQLIRGGSLGKMLRERGKIPAEEACEIISQVGKGLREAHRSGVIHRDIKPDNILVGKGSNYKITDFGLALMGNQASASLGQVVGTPHYISPEQVDAQEVDARTDIYALGATLYHMMTGQPPFKGVSTIDLLMKHVNEPLVPPHEREPSIPAGISQIVCRMMAKRVDDRYATIDEVIADLDAPELVTPAAQDAEPVQVRQPTLLLSGQAPPMLRPSTKAAKAKTPRTLSYGSIGLVVVTALLIGLGLGPIREVLADVHGPDLGGMPLDDRVTLDQVAREVKFLDLPAAIARYEALIAENPDSALAAEAQQRIDALRTTHEKALVKTLDGIIEQARALQAERKLGPATDLLSSLDPGLADLPRASEVPPLLAELREAIKATGMVWVPPAKDVSLGEGKGTRTVESAPGFYIDLREVTRAAYADHMSAPGMGPPASWKDGKLPAGTEGLPVTDVTLEQARAFARKRGKRLPTAAEWERAARGPDGRRWPWGDTADGGACNGSWAGSQPKAPGSFEQDVSGYGCLDMAGNVSELTVEPQTPGKASVRGGSYLTRHRENTRAAFDVPLGKGDHHVAIGFRCAADALPEGGQ